MDMFSIYCCSIPVFIYYISFTVYFNKSISIVIIPDIFIIFYSAVFSSYFVNIFESFNWFVIIRYIRIYIFPFPAPIDLFYSLPVSNDLTIIINDHIEFIFSRNRHIVQWNFRIQFPFVIHFHLSGIPPCPSTCIISFGIFIGTKRWLKVTFGTVS